MKLSAIIIARNEEDLIEDCLASVAFCDQIVVVDNGSTDRTIEISKKHKVDVFAIKEKSFAQMRNIGLEKAKGEWILYIDADERVTLQLKEEIQTITEGVEEKDVYKIRRKNFYYGNHAWPYQDHLERLFKKKNLKRWDGELHESPIYTGEVGELKSFLIHYSHRNLSQMVKKTIEWSKVEAQLRFDANHPKMTWWRFPRVMFSGFYDSYIRQSGWKAGTVGIIESMYQAFSMFVTYARLWELQLQAESKK